MWVSKLTVHCSAVQLSGAGINNLNPDFLSTIVWSREIQTIWSSLTATFSYNAGHLVQTSDNLRKPKVISLHDLTGTCNDVTYPIGTLTKYFVLWQMSQLPIYSLMSQEKDSYSNLSVRAFILFSIPSWAVAAWASAIAISRKFLPPAWKLLGNTSLYSLFRFWTYRNLFLFCIFFLLFFGAAQISFQIGYTLMHAR